MKVKELLEKLERARLTAKANGLTQEEFQDLKIRLIDDDYRSIDDAISLQFASTQETLSGIAGLKCITPELKALIKQQVSEDDYFIEAWLNRHDE